MPASRRFSADLLLWDFLILGGIALWISSAAFLDHGAAAELFRQKPWVHRLLVTAALGGAWFLWAVRRTRVLQAKAPPTPLMLFAARLAENPRPVVGVLFVLLFVQGTAASWIRHEALHTSFDLALFTQGVWSASQGHLLQSSVKGGMSLLGDHFSPLLLALAPLYRVWPDPRLLLYLQAAAAAAAVFPLYRIAEDVLKDRSQALALVLSFALYLPLRNAVRFDFHPEMLVTPLLLAAFDRIRRGQLAPASLLLGVILLSKENAALVIGAFGVYGLLFVPRGTGFGVFWITASAAYFYAAVKIWIPHFSGQEYFYLSGNFLAWQKEGAGAFLAHLLNRETAAYLIKILAPVGFLSVLDLPAFLLTLPMFAQNLLSRNEATRSIFFQYTAYLTPLVFASAACGAARLKNRRHLTVWILGWAVAMAGVCETHVIREHLGKITPLTRDIAAHLAAVPPEKSLRTHEFYAPQAANRKGLYIFENQNPREGASAAALSADVIAVSSDRMGADTPAHLAWIREHGYAAVYENQGFTIFEKEK